eukprot:CAMPEP_0178954430 /NCGR_PEP_ID=MMETSP0789-20121207/8983_1 /TAXON_ID=3005 /ORGANISM="Rhizosolenia setigera, Strain CCMP 1694" /LENGTH=477 /DNA_ID=CAMNT_0020635825 /DNA_START=32 /DNA_END=1466 /DNA_ORIENTATION=+
MENGIEHNTEAGIDESLNESDDQKVLQEKTKDLNQQQQNSTPPLLSKKHHLAEGLWHPRNKKAKITLEASDLINFNSLNDDNLDEILQFTGERCYATFGLINKRCKQTFVRSGMAKETFIFGYAPMLMISKRENDQVNYDNLSEGVVLYNRIDLLDSALKRNNGEELTYICQNAAAEGRLSILKKVFLNSNASVEKHLIENGELISQACLSGNFEILKYLVAKGCPIVKSEACSDVAENGDLEMLKWLRVDQGCSWDENIICQVAVVGGNIEMIQWLLSQGCHLNGEVMCRDAAYHGHLQLLKWLRLEKKCSWNESSICEHAANSGNMEMLKWLQSQGIFFNKKICCEKVAFSGNLETLKWLREDQNCPWDSKLMCDSAAVGGNIEMIKWVQSEGCDLDGESACDSAAHYGHLKTLKWLMEDMKCFFDKEHILESAINGDNIELLKYQDQKVVIGQDGLTLKQKKQQNQETMMYYAG